MSLNLRKWDISLAKLSQELMPSKAGLRFAKSVYNRLFRELHSKSKFSIDRTMVMGSVGKKTALEVDYDFDCVIFVNNITAEDFDRVKDDFEDVLILSNLDVEDANNTRIPLKITIEGLDFDLVPAVNFRDENRNEEQQWKRALARIKALPNPARGGYKYSSSLEERQIKFIKQQTVFTHDMIRLAKYWNRTIFISNYLTGRSSLIECIATYAANKEEDYFENGRSILRAFRCFLELVVQFHTLDIIFEMFYERSDVDSSIANRRPLVMDPSNPYNNLAYGLVQSPHIMAKFQEFAKTTLDRMDSTYSESSVGIAAVFQTQPVSAPYEFVSRFLPKSSSWQVRIEDRNRGENMKTTVRNGYRLKKLGKYILQIYLCNNIQHVQGRRLTKHDLTSKVMDIINTEIYGKSTHSGLGSGTSRRNHSKYDVTYEIPCGSKLIKVSFNCI